MILNVLSLMTKSWALVDSIHKISMMNGPFSTCSEINNSDKVLNKLILLSDTKCEGLVW